MPHVINDVEDGLGGLKARLKENKKGRETETDRQSEREREKHKETIKNLTSKFCCKVPKEVPA